MPAHRWKNRIADVYDEMETRRREGTNSDFDIMEDGSRLKPFGDIQRINDAGLSLEKELPMIEGIKGKRLAIMLAVVAIIGTGVLVVGDQMQRNPVRETAKPAKKIADNDENWTVPSVSREPDSPPMPTDEDLDHLEAQRRAQQNTPPKGAEAFFTNGR